MNEISPRLLAYLAEWYATSTANQRKAGVTVELTLEQFRELFAPRQIKTLEDAIAQNRLRYLQDRSNQFAFVLSWRSYDARTSNVMSRDTAIICSRMRSRQINLPTKGQRLRDAHCQAISKGLTGRRKSDEHRANMSEALKGTAKEPWSEERKAARRAQIAARKAGVA